MPLFISLMRLTQRGLDEIAGSPGRVTISRQRVEALGGRSLAFYATMGTYDFVQVFEMPSAAAMHEYVLTARKDGYVEPLILPAFDDAEWAARVKALAAASGPAPR